VEKQINLQYDMKIAPLFKERKFYNLRLLKSAALDKTIYVFGGEGPEGTFNNNEKYDPRANNWTSELSMPTPRHGLVAAAVNDRIYVIGGGFKPGLTVSGLNEIFIGNKTAN
jgi:N-acetylneuraminic acid mutarotase